MKTHQWINILGNWENKHILWRWAVILTTWSPYMANTMYHTWTSTLSKDCKLPGPKLLIACGLAYITKKYLCWKYQKPQNISSYVYLRVHIASIFQNSIAMCIFGLMVDFMLKIGISYPVGCPFIMGMMPTEIGHQNFSEQQKSKSPGSSQFFL